MPLVSLAADLAREAPQRSKFARLFLVLTAYFATGYLGLKLPYYDSHITLVWLPTGIAVAALWRWGAGMWPGVAGGAFLVNWAIGSTPALAAQISLGNTLAPLVVVYWLRHMGFSPTLCRQVDAVIFLTASALGMVLSSTGGVAALSAAGLIEPGHLLEAGFAWWVGDTAGLLLVGPLLLSLNETTVARLRAESRGFVGWAAVALLLAWLAFDANYGQPTQRLPLAFLTVPVFAWAAVHFGILATSCSSIGFAGMAIWAASAGVGAFHLQDPQLGLVMLWSYIFTLQLTGLLLVALQNERDTAREVLLKNEERLRLMTQSLKDYSLIMLDAAGRVVSWTEGSHRVHGYSEAEILGQPHSVFYPPEQIAADLPAALLARARETGHAHDLSWRVRKDGTRYFADTTLSPVRGPSGVLVGYAKITRDITESKLAELEQARLTRDLRLLGEVNLLLAKATDEHDLLDESCRLMATAGGYRMAWVGVPEQDAAKSVRVVARAGEQLGYLDSVEISWDSERTSGQGTTGTALRTGKTAVNQNARVHPKYAPWRESFLKHGFESSIALPLFSENAVKGALMLYAAEPDAFGPREVELLEELARNLGVGLQMLHAREQRDSAQAASRAKSTFLANMSHEIRTPLNGILGMVYLMRREGVSPKQAARLNTIAASADHLLGVINDILDISKIEADKVVLEATDVSVEALLGNVASIVATRAREKGLKLRVDDEVGARALRGDATRLTQALLNYASNAIKFTEKGTITLKAVVAQEDADSILLRFEVVDTGIGVSGESVDRLFRAFEQADSSTTRQYGGTGLGLAITKRLAQLMAGDAGVDTVPGHGSTFWFTARLQESVAEPRVAHSSDDWVDAEAALPELAKGKTVLLVEDEPINRMVAEEMLERCGFAVDVAEDGMQAVELAQRKPYDLVLMDVQMPRMDGLEATARIRQMDTHYLTPIIATTANAFAEDRERCLSVGMDDFLAKPVRPTEFYATLLKWLTQSRGSSTRS